MSEEMDRALRRLRGACATFLTLADCADAATRVEVELREVAGLVDGEITPVEEVAAALHLERLQTRNSDNPLVEAALTCALLLEFGDPNRALTRAVLTQLAEWAGQIADAAVERRLAEEVTP